MNWRTKLMLTLLPIVLWLISTPLTAQSSSETPQPTSSPPSMISTDDCESTCEADCTAELDKERKEIQSQCEMTTTTAIADERRHYEPVVANLRIDVERLETKVVVWQIVAGVGVVFGIAGLVCAFIC